MKNNEYLFLKELEHDMRLLNHELGNNFNIDLIDTKEDLSELYKNTEIKKNPEMTSKTFAEELLKKTDNLLNSIFLKISKKKKNYKNIYLDLNFEENNEESEKIGPNKFFTDLFKFFKKEKKNKIFILNFEKNSKNENDNKEFLEDLKYMIADFFLTFKKIDQFIFNLTKSTAEKVKKIVDFTTVNKLGFYVFFVNKDKLKIPFDEAFGESDNLFKINKIWFKMGNFDENEEILDLDDFEVYSIIVL